MAVNSALLERIHGCNIYENFPVGDYQLDLNNWNSKHPFFDKYIDLIRPKLILELGTWKGSSAVHMASYARSIGLECPLICIDNWLGHWHWWLKKDEPVFNSELRANEPGKTLWKDINTKHGWPTVFYQFLANVILTNNQEIIVPIPQGTTHGMVLMRRLKLQPDLIYVDADHDYEPVYKDIVDAFDLLAPGGALLGDDYSSGFPGVMKAVDQFASESGLAFEKFAPNKWAFIKPKA